jgi:hypothetical protein
MGQDKQLHGISLEAVVQKRTLDQALNAKEFAVLAGISYSAARTWFRRPGFPVVSGVVFWQDFVQWRKHQTGLNEVQPDHTRISHTSASAETVTPKMQLPERAAQILREASR